MPDMVVRRLARRLPAGVRRQLRRVPGLGRPAQRPAAWRQPVVGNPATGRPVIGLAGFFGAGNYGDELFLEVFKQYFGDEFELRVLADLTSKPYYSRPVTDIVAEVDAILIGGGDILQPWSRDPRYFNPAFLKKPVFVVGIGVPQYSWAKKMPDRPETIAQHRRFLHHANVKRIGVRDDQAAQWIREHIEPPQDVLVAPDIVCALNLPDAPKPAGAPILGVATRLRRNLEEPDDYSRIAELAEKAIADGWKVRHIILGTNEVGRRDAENASDLDVPGKEVVHRESLDDITRAIGECTAFASMKFHGSVVATMYGIPSLVMIPTNKNVNFMRRIGLDALLSRFDAPDLVAKFEARPKVDPEAIARIRSDADAHMRGLVDAIRQVLG
jgi:polysaccharide pyruvyl transferase WcaK-like protein